MVALREGIAAAPPTPASSPGWDALAERRAVGIGALAGARFPTKKNESYRFTDVSGLLEREYRPALAGLDVDARAASAVARLALPEAECAARVVFVDGVFSPGLSKLDGTLAGASVGNLECLPASELDNLGALAPSRRGVAAGSKEDAEGDLFAAVCEAAATDCAVVVVPDGVALAGVVHVLFLASGAEGSLSAPRLLVRVGKGAEAAVVEEHVTLASEPASFLCASLAECDVAEGGKLAHAYLNAHSTGAYQVKRTCFQQAERSELSHVEVTVGGRVSRHNLGLAQVGVSTATRIRSFVLCGRAQTGDLHSSLTFNHPGGESSQVHKCIAADRSSQGVFHGQIRVNRLAQRTDAGQLTKSLLLARGASVNVMPNLQIVADDVACSHGATIADLNDEEVFYLRTRGIDEATARAALVASFGADVLADLRTVSPALFARAQVQVAHALADLGVKALPLAPPSQGPGDASS